MNEPDDTPDERPWVDQGASPPNPSLPPPNTRRRPPGDDPAVMSADEFFAHFGDPYEPPVAPPDPLTTPIITLSPSEPADFVAFWSPLYEAGGYDECFYRANIGRPLAEQPIEAWFAWKNGGPLSAKKTRTVTENFTPTEAIGPDATKKDLRAFLLRDGGVVWRVFWVHIQHPKNYPIFDQHVYRAMRYLRGMPEKELPTYPPSAANAYLDEYRPFFDEFPGDDRRAVDQALWAFGKFLKTPYGWFTIHAQS